MLAIIKKGIIIIIALYLLGFLAIYLLQEKMIFMPGSLPEGYEYSFSGNFEEVFLTAADGAKLNALHFKVASPKGVVLYFHGNAGELSQWGKVVQKFPKLGYDVLVMDYRGYGKSTGKRKEASMYADAQLFYDYLLKSYAEGDISVYGRSLGTTFATYVAAYNNPRQLLLEAPFYSLLNVAKERFPIYPVGWFLKFHFPTYQFITQVSCPITIFHGTDDHTVSFGNSQRLINLPVRAPLKLVPIKGADHNDLDEYPRYQIKLDSVL